MNLFYSIAHAAAEEVYRRSGAWRARVEQDCIEVIV